MDTDLVYRKYAAIALVALGLAGFLAVVLGLNIHRMLRSDRPPMVREEPAKTEPLAAGLHAQASLMDVGRVRYS